ncbi:MAG: peptidoglycan/xylan/chitin deacetylase (PgdA/CDA1 family) [Moritella sp.]|jgi:peptidoglycan/xylan/chitin deacetylase (PgdA/CDA1 family)
MDFLKTLYLNLLHRLGIFQLFHYFSRHKITILYVHGIMGHENSVMKKSTKGNGQDHQWTPLRDQLSPQQLAASLHALSQQYTFISLSDAVKILTKDIPPVKNALVITLDDGYLNNIKYGAPLFKQFNIIPSLFIATEHTQHNRPFWFDRLDYALQQIAENHYQVQIEQDPFCFDCSSRASLKTSYAKFRQIIKTRFTCDMQMRKYLDKITSKIEQETGKALSDIIDQDDWSAIATWQQLAEVINDGSFEIGNHTLNHARLALVDAATMDTEIQQAKNIIEQKLAIKCSSFCYPDNSYSPAVISMIRDRLYACGLTTDTGLNSIGCNMQTLKRFNMPIHKNPKKILYAISALRN